MTIQTPKSPSEVIGDLILKDIDGKNPIPFRECWIFQYVEKAITLERSEADKLRGEVERLEKVVSGDCIHDKCQWQQLYERLRQQLAHEKKCHLENIKIAREAMKATMLAEREIERKTNQ